MRPALLVTFALALPVQAQLVIPLWHTLGEGGVLEGYVQAFNGAQNRFRIEPRFVGDYREMGVLLAAALRNGTAPPAAQVELGFLPVLVREGLLEALTPLQEPDLDSQLLALGRVGGRLYGYPLGISVAVLFFNQQALAARQVRPPRTFAELAQAAERLSSRSARGLLFSADAYSFSALVLARGGWLVREGRPSFNHPQAVATLSYLQDMARRGALQARGATEIWAAGADFLRTKAFLALGPSTLLPAAQGRANWPFAIGLAPPPLEAEGRVAASGSVLVVLRGASPEVKQGLEAFYRYVAEPERQIFWAQSTYYLPLSLQAQRVWAREDVGRLLLGLKGMLVPWHQEGPLLLWASALERSLERALKAGLPAPRALDEGQQEALRTMGPLR
ncbi:extracellular solute-binding protein [Thermus thermamylovorans]|uniref:Extracellular solute-binding protein n=1 Tax=Thermus thermamylovorans TaxID=2509362 RepID=A0A4V2IVD3_9DEIN|nr:extracellular solute-binding protein [Thermus thermamylovorans]TBH21920.1 extracellular solute-binding protein [Thermus thermamylovorans]